MSLILFHTSQVIALAQRATELAKKNGTIHTRTTLFDGQYYPDGVPLNKAGQSESQTKGEFFWPDPKHCCHPAPVLLQLVGDHGVYLMCNAIADNNMTPNESGLIVYGIGFDPNNDEDAHVNKREAFGGDDDVIDIDVISFVCQHDSIEQFPYFGVRLSQNDMTIRLYQHKPAHYEYG